MSSESGAPSSPSSTYTSNNGGDAAAGDLIPDVDAMGSEIVPSAALVAVENGLRHDKGPHFYTTEIQQCFQATLQVLSAAENDRLDSHSEWFVSEFLNEVVPDLLSRVLKDQIPRRWATFFPDVFGWCMSTTKIGCVLLRQFQDNSLDERTTQVIRCLLIVFDVRSEFSKAYTLASRGREVDTDGSADEQDGDGAWRVMLAEAFQDDGGLDSLCKIFDIGLYFPEFEYLERLIVLASRVAMAGQKVLDLRGLAQVCAQLLENLKDGPPPAWRCSSMAMSNVVASIFGILTLADSAVAAEEVVGKYQQHVVSEQLKNGTFNTRLAAVQWLEGIVHKAFRTESEGAIQRVREWLKEDSIVECMLSEHLEKTHYAEQVLVALRAMAQTGFLLDEHIAALYRVIEPEGTFEGLKENVHTIMLHLVGFLKAEQVSSTMQIAMSVVEDVTSATRMSNLVHRVASMDREQVAHFDQAMSLLWKMMVEYSHIRVESDPLWRNFARCMHLYTDGGCSELQEKYYQLTVEELMEGKVTVMMLQCLTTLFDEHKDSDVGLLKVVVLALQRYHEMSLADMQSNTESSGGANLDPSPHPYDVNVTIEGLKQVQKIAVWGKLGRREIGFGLEVTERLWDSLVMQSVCADERQQALEWFIGLASIPSEAHTCVLTDEDAKALLNGRLCQLDPVDLDVTAFRCFRAFFIKVSLHTGFSGASGVEYLWRVLLSNSNCDVAGGAQELVGSLYMRTVDSQHEFVRHTMSLLKESVCNLAGSDADSMSCSEAIQRLNEAELGEMDERCVMRIMRCLQALDFMLRRAQLASISQSEDLNGILLYLADCPHPVHEVACSLLDALPLRSKVVELLRSAVSSRNIDELNSVIYGTLHRGASTDHLLPEKTRYAILALAEVLRCVDDRKAKNNHSGDVIHVCLTFLLDALKNVDTKRLWKGDELATRSQRLHYEGVRLVSRLTSHLESCPTHSNLVERGLVETEKKPTATCEAPTPPQSPSSGSLPQTQSQQESSAVIVHNCVASEEVERERGGNGQGGEESIPGPSVDVKMDVGGGAVVDAQRELGESDSGLNGLQQEETSCQERGSSMDMSTHRNSGGQCSSMDGVSEQRTSDGGERGGGSGSAAEAPGKGLENGHRHLPTISETLVAFEGGFEQQDGEPIPQRSHELARNQEKASMLENPTSACSSSEVGAVGESPQSEPASADLTQPSQDAMDVEADARQNETRALPSKAQDEEQGGDAGDIGTSQNGQVPVQANDQEEGPLPSASVSVLLNKVMEYYLFIISEAGGGWECTGCGHKTDVELVREAAEQLGSLVSHWEDMLHVVTSCKEVADVLVTSLLSPVDCIRKQMVNLVRRLNKCGASVAPWLFQLLKDRRCVADERTECCHEFYGLLQEFCRGFGKCTRLVEVEAAGGLLQEVLRSIRAQPYEESPTGQRLGCQLRLLTQLIKILESEAAPPQTGDNKTINSNTCSNEEKQDEKKPVGSDTAVCKEGDLVQFIMKDILFPETCLLRREGEGVPSTMELMEVLKTKSTPLSTREAAFDLLLALMKISSVSHTLAMDLIWKLHFTSSALRQMDTHWQPARNPCSYVGLQNAGATCYMNAVLQQLFMQPSIRTGVLSAEAVVNEEDRGVFYAFQRLFGHLLCSDRSSFFPGDFIERYTHSDGQEVDIRQHHDALEFFQRTQELVDDYMSRQGLKAVIKNAIGGIFSQQIICRDSRKVFFSETQQPYTEVTLEMFGKTNLQESLEAYVSGERLEGDNAYFCQEWGKKVPALKRTCIKTLPKTLVIHLKRFELDYETMETFKIQERFEFPLTLDMFPYTSSFLLQKEGICKEDGVNCDPQDSICPSQCQYQLMGVVVHKGEIDGGHYYSFVKERQCGEKIDEDCGWWRFDDSSVDEWDIGRLDEDCFGGPKIDDDLTDRRSTDVTEDTVKSRANNAYLLIYEQIRRESEEAKADAIVGTNDDVNLLKKQLPLSIFEEVLIENTRLLSATRVTDRGFMHFMQKLLHTMPNVPACRKMRRLTPPDSKSGSGSSSGSDAGGQGSEESQDRENSSEGTGRREDAETMAQNIADLVFEYMLRIMFTPGVFSESDYASWEQILKVTQDSRIALHVALEKLALYADRVARCLLPHSCEASSDFVFHFVMIVIKEARKMRLEPLPQRDDVKSSPIYMLGSGIIEACESRAIIPLDLYRVFEVVRCCALMTLKWGDRTLIFKALNSMHRTSAKLSTLVWAGRNNSLHKKLESLNGLLVTSVRNVITEIGEDGGRVPRDIKDCFFNEWNPDFIKGFVHPVLLIQDVFLEFLQAYMRDSDTLSMWVLDGVLDLLTEENERLGWLDQFDKISASILKLLATQDCFYTQSQRVQYLITPRREHDREGLYQTVFLVGSHALRWKLIYLVMRIAKQENSEDVNQLFRNVGNERLLSWAIKDPAVIHLESYIDRKEVIDWVRQIVESS
ncbi:hypothetical protein BSKO_07208 [Bryopsis sp. KO-2023]|nr:hypothetical protein BSKO_07208 [Bryopsis sp. KO-2023]